MKIDSKGRVVLEGGGNYGFAVAIEGIDLVSDRASATFFGGDDDPDDDGETASGVMTKGNPGVMGCALPMSFEAACAGTPIPRLPWHTQLEVTNIHTGAKCTVGLIDVGPAAPPHAKGDIDLTIAASKVLNGGHEDNLTVSWRISGGLHLLPASLQSEIKAFLVGASPANPGGEFTGDAEKFPQQ